MGYSIGEIRAWAVVQYVIKQGIVSLEDAIEDYPSILFEMELELGANQIPVRPSI